MQPLLLLSILQLQYKEKKSMFYNSTFKKHINFFLNFLHFFSHFFFLQSASTYPVIAYTEEDILKINECEVYCGEERICKCIDLSRAVIILIGTYYVFGIQYPKEAILTLKLIQHLLCNITDTAKKTKKFLKLVNNICSNI